MQKVKVQTTQNVIIEYEPASVGDRIVAHIVDALVLVAGIIPIVILVVNLKNENITMLLLILYGGFYLLYDLIWEIFFNGQSFGKKQRNIKVVKLDGSQPGIGSYILRWLLRPIDVLLYGIVAILCISIGGKGQRLGDIVAGTTVIRINRKDTFDNTLFSKTDENYVPVFNEVVKLSDRDIEIIKEAINTYRNGGNFIVVKKVADKTEELIGRKSELPPIKFLNTVIKDYNHLTGKL